MSSKKVESIKELQRALSRVNTPDPVQVLDEITQEVENRNLLKK